MYKEIVVYDARHWLVREKVLLFQSLFANTLVSIMPRYPRILHKNIYVKAQITDTGLSECICKTTYRVYRGCISHTGAKSRYGHCYLNTRSLPTTRTSQNHAELYEGTVKPPGEHCRTCERGINVVKANWYFDHAGRNGVRGKRNFVCA